MKKFFNLTETINEDASSYLLGGKGFGLWVISNAFLPYPETWVVSPYLFKEFIEQIDITMGHSNLIKSARSFISTQLEEYLSELPDYTYAIRSSGIIEDSFEQSFASLFSSKLNVNHNDIPLAIAEVWVSGLSKPRGNYRSGNKPPVYCWNWYCH